MPDRFIPKAEDVMTRRLVTLRPDMSVLSAMRTLVEHQVSGAPVLDGDNSLCGIVSELDCMRILVAGQFSQDSYEEEARVADIMTREVLTIAPDLDLFGVAQRFLKNRVRRLPVVREGRLLGMVSRRDVLAGVEKMRHAMRQQPKEPKAKGLYLSANDQANSINTLPE